MQCKVNKDLCIGCGTCLILAPNSFRINEDGKAEVIEPMGDDEQAIKDARDNCPTGAIEIE